MKFIVNVARFWYDFIVGDDWTIAAAVVIALIVTNVLVRANIAAWWILPAVVLAFLGFSLLRVARPRS